MAYLLSVLLSALVDALMNKMRYKYLVVQLWRVPMSMDTLTLLFDNVAKYSSTNYVI
jgi:hypothetical protein